MANLCKYVAQEKSLNFDDEEIKDICQAVDIFMNRLVAALQEDKQELKINKLRFCGSMAEQTRVKQYGCLEFDYLAELQGWPNGGTLWAMKAEECSAFIEFDVLDTDSVMGKRDFLSNTVADVFFYDSVAAAQRRCQTNSCCRLVGIGGIHNFESGCKFCTVYTGSGKLTFRSEVYSRTIDIRKKLSFTWRPALFDDAVYKFVSCDDVTLHISNEYRTIEVDFHPIFVVECLSEENRSIALFPKSRTNPLYWRLSTYEQETKIIKASSQQHKIAFMTLKSLYDTSIGTKQLSFKSFEDIHPYCLKNVLLLHIRWCRKAGKIPRANRCLCQMLGLLSKCYLENNLPHFQLKYNMFDPDFRDRMHQQELGHALMTLKQLLTIPGAYNDINDIQKDAVTTDLIVSACRRECPPVDEYKQGRYALLISVALKSFVTIRRKNSSFDAMKHFVIKYWFLFQRNRESLDSLLHGIATGDEYDRELFSEAVSMAEI